MGLDEFIPYSFFNNIDKRATNYNFCPQLSHHTKVLFCGSKGDLNKEKKMAENAHSLPSIVSSSSVKAKFYFENCNNARVCLKELLIISQLIKITSEVGSL